MLPKASFKHSCGKTGMMSDPPASTLVQENGASSSFVPSQLFEMHDTLLETFLPVCFLPCCKNLAAALFHEMVICRNTCLQRGFCRIFFSA